MSNLDTSKAVRRVYKPYPTLHKFHHDISQVRGVMGPTGSGKSVGCIAEIAMRAQEQEPDAAGLRPTRWAVVRETYPALISTTLKTWSTWMPQSHVNMSPPMTWKWKQNRAFKDGTGIDMEVIFLSVKDPKADISKLRSLDVTGIWVNEAQEIQDRVLIEWMINRCGRFPDPQRAPLTWSGLLADANAMPTDHWWYDWAEESKPTGYRFWRQPPALLKVPVAGPGSVADGQGQHWIINPQCENLPGQAKHAQYWLDQVPGKATAWIDLNLCAEYGSSLEGKPVYPEFDNERHVSKTALEPIHGIPLQLGFDYGLTPSVIICQITPQGQLRCLDECCSVSMGMRQFLRDGLKPMLANKYPHFPVKAIGEPSGNKRAESDESTANDEIRAQGIDISDAPTNFFKPRRDAVASFMLKRVQSTITGVSTAEGFIVSPTCIKLLKGFREKYLLHKVQIQGREAYKDEPADNGFDHIQDALQAVAVAYDRPRQADAMRDRRNADGSPTTIEFAGDYPTV